MTMDEVRGAIGRQRAAWVETTGSAGALAILVRAARCGDAVLIRYADPRGGYRWTGAERLRRRQDLDAGPEPAWLQQARVSPRPPAILWDILNMSAIKAEARAVEDVTLASDQPLDTWNDCPDCGAAWKDPVPTPGVLHRTRLCVECLRQLHPDFDTDAAGAVL